MILTNDQAEAVCAAMCGLKKVGGTVRAYFGTIDNGVHVEPAITGSGALNVWDMAHGLVRGQETYTSQDDFAAAYKLAD